MPMTVADLDRLAAEYMRRKLARKGTQPRLKTKDVGPHRLKTKDVRYTSPDDPAGDLAHLPEAPPDRFARPNPPTLAEAVRRVKAKAGVRR